MATDLEIAARKVISRNPATGEVVCELECASESDANSSVAERESARSWHGQNWAFESESQFSASFRRSCTQRKSEIAAAITREAGKAHGRSVGHRSAGCARCGPLPDRQRLELLRDEPVPHGNLATKLKSGRLVREPHGVDRNHLAVELSVLDSRDGDTGGPGSRKCRRSEALGTDSAQWRWNWPSLLHAAGVPKEVFQVVVGDGADRRGAGSMPPIDKLVFTGSVATGKRIAADRGGTFASGRARTWRKRSHARARRC